MEILNDEAGAPTLRLTGEAQQLLRAMRVEHVHLSISHTTEHAVAQVILER